jgi:ribosome-binding protein aMBF1 (putative translation factor)
MSRSRRIVVDGQIQCTMCGEWKDMDTGFYYDKVNQRHMSWCRECAKGYGRHKRQSTKVTDADIAMLVGDAPEA